MIKILGDERTGYKKLCTNETRNTSSVLKVQELADDEIFPLDKLAMLSLRKNLR